MKGSLQHVQVSIAEDLQRVKDRQRELKVVMCI